MEDRFPISLKIKIALWAVLLGGGLGFAMPHALALPFGYAMRQALQIGILCGMIAGFIAFALPMILEPILATRLKAALIGLVGGALGGLVFGTVIAALGWLVARAVIGIAGRAVFRPVTPQIVIMAVIGLLLGIALIVVGDRLEKADKLPRLPFSK